MRFSRNYILIKYVHAIKAYIQQWVCGIVFYIEIAVHEIIETELFRLRVVRVHIYEERVLPLIIIGVERISNYQSVPAYQRFFLWQLKYVSYIIMIQYAHVNSHAVKSIRTDIFKCYCKLKCLALLQSIWRREIQIRCNRSLWDGHIIGYPIL